MTTFGIIYLFNYCYRNHIWIRLDLRYQIRYIELATGNSFKPFNSFISVPTGISYWRMYISIS